MARKKSYQRGTVIERNYDYGMAYVLRYRIRNSTGVKIWFYTGGSWKGVVVA